MSRKNMFEDSGPVACCSEDADDLLVKLIHYGPVASLSTEDRRELFDRIRLREAEGYDLAGADGTLELLVRETVQPDVQFFTVLRYEVTSRMKAELEIKTTASVTIEAGGAVLVANASGHGPINALDLALRQSLSTVYASLGKVKLIDYKVRMLEPGLGTAARVRVLIDWAAGDQKWSTAGVSDDIIEASWLALTDAIRLELMRLREGNHTRYGAIEDRSWAV